MKMSGPKGVITVGSLIEHAFDCDVECVEHAEALVLDESLVADMEKLVNEGPDPLPSMQAALTLSSRPRMCPSTPLPPRVRC
jgi:hypothetical protein